jgi:hypothetical protein
MNKSDDPGFPFALNLPDQAKPPCVHHLLLEHGKEGNDNDKYPEKVPD